jgi:uncharacterized Tic20 family protein
LTFPEVAGKGCTPEAGRCGKELSICHDTLGSLTLIAACTDPDELISNKGIYMLNYERHLVVVTIVCLVIIAVAVAAVILEVPLPFIGKD